MRLAGGVSERREGHNLSVVVYVCSLSQYLAHLWWELPCLSFTKLNVHLRFLSFLMPTRKEARLLFQMSNITTSTIRGRQPKSVASLGRKQMHTSRRNFLMGGEDKLCFQLEEETCALRSWCSGQDLPYH